MNKLRRRVWPPIGSWSVCIASLGVIAALTLPQILALLPGLAVGYVLYLVCLGLIYAIVAVGLNVLIGVAGQFSIGHAGFLAIGAYTSAILMQRFGWPFVFSLPASGLLTAGVGWLVGLPALRLSGPYLALATLGFGLAIPQLALWLEPLTGGQSGLHSIPSAAIPIGYSPAAGVQFFAFRSEREFYYLALAALVVLTWFAVQLIHSRTGRAFIAIRDSEVAAQAMGVNLARYKTTAFALSAFYTGIAGSLYTSLLHSIGAEDFTFFLSVEFLVMIVLGGLGSIRGAWIGAFVLTAITFLLPRLPIVRDFKNLYIVVFGSVLILTVLFLPQGIDGLLRRISIRRPPSGVSQKPVSPMTTADAVTEG